MTQTTVPKLADHDAAAIPLVLVSEKRFDSWLNDQTERVAIWVKASGFSPSLGAHCVVPGRNGEVESVVVGFGSQETRQRRRFGVAKAYRELPEGTTYRLEGPLQQDDLAEAVLGWLLAAYKFTRYAGKTLKPRSLICPQGIDATRIEAVVASEFLVRDLINTPANDMGPDELEAAAIRLADAQGAETSVIRGEDLLQRNFPLIHTVGRASSRTPRLIELNWGIEGPLLSLVGKGVCFDTGGLNIKPGASMALMKKDMGGAANVLGLANMIMQLKLPLRLQVLIPAVENTISGEAFRPGDILTARNGLTVEINNTDAEGRLVLADALVYASESKPDLTVSMATLTGAARVAVGPDIAPFYATEPALADDLRKAADRVRDPVWEMPFHPAYEAMIEPGIADLDNAPSGGFAGSITAALFLKRFAGEGAYLHFDVYGWQPNAAPARPKGGVGQGIRAVFDALPSILDL